MTNPKFNFSTYYQLGMSCFPLRGKHPLVSWKKYQETRPDETNIKLWDNTPHNIGIATGHVSEILVVDVDGEYPPEWEAMPDTWTVKTKKGFHYYFYMPVDTDFRNSARIAENVDIRANGGYVVAPPSVHPDGGNYEWLEGKSPSDITIADIPEFLLKVLEKHSKRLYEPPVQSEEKPKEAAPVVSAKNDADYETAYIEAAIKAECDILRGCGEGGRNDQLNKCAFALAGLMDAGRVEDILTPIALEIGLGHIEIKKTIDSGCQSARKREIPPPKAGYVPPPESPEHEEMSLIVKSTLERHGKTIQTNEIAPRLISEAPGFIGDMIRWVLETSLYPQPVLALAASITAAGHIMGHKAQTETGLRTNFFTMGIAESGAGKDHARKCVSKLFNETGIQDGLTGDPASATGVIGAVNRANGTALMQIDEMGRYLKSISGNNAASHNQMVTTNMMHMYNSASDMFIGQEYANNETNGGRADIDQPCLNIYGTTVPHNFYGSLTSEEAYDGFLSRWLIFETTRFDIEPQLDRAEMKPPKALCESVNWWAQQPKFCGGEGGIGHYTMIKPRTVEFDPDARAAFYALIKECRIKMSKSDSPIDKAFWNRCAEHAAKLALAGHVGDTIDINVFNWAMELSKALTVSTIENIKANISDNAYEADLQSVLKMIKAKGSMTKSEVTRNTRTMDRRRRQDILETLIEAGDIREEKTKKEGSNKHLTEYFA